MKGNSRISRRGFMQLSSGALVAGGVLGPASQSNLPSSVPAGSDPMSLAGKIALEEHSCTAGLKRGA